MTLSRSHHYIPEFYLARFTASGSKDDFLWVRDLEQGKEWKTRPRNAAHIRDYYRLEVEDVEPDVLEKVFGQVEGQAAPVLERTSTTRELPEGEDFDVLLNFIALMVVRVPSFRTWLEQSTAEMSKFILQMLVGQREAYESAVEEMRREGYELPESARWEEMRDFILDDSRYTIEVEPSSTLGTIVGLIGGILPTLAPRNWTLLVANDDAPDIVCCDQPVALYPCRKPPVRSLGFGQPWTEVSIPLGRRTALVGRFDEVPTIIQADRLLVGYTNQRMLDSASRFVFSAVEEIVVTRPRE